MALGIIVMRSPYTPYSIYLRGAINSAVVWSNRDYRPLILKPSLEEVSFGFPRLCGGCVAPATLGNSPIE